LSFLLDPRRLRRSTTRRKSRRPKRLIKRKKL
jgi:hypothetical protein